MLFEERLVLVETPDAADVIEVVREHCTDATPVLHPDPFHLVCTLLRRLSNEELGYLALHGIRDEQRRRVDGLPGPNGATGSNVVLQVN